MAESVGGNDPYGYLLVHFREDPHGYAERIYMDLSDGDDPLRWSPLNHGEPMLTSGIGTTGVRDPCIACNPQTGEYFIIATDLRVFGGRSEHGENWYDWSHSGSTSFMVWRSADLVHWQGPEPLDVACTGVGSVRLHLGMAWACSCVWVPDFWPEGHPEGRGTFVMLWSSTPLPEGGKCVDGSGSEHSVIMWGTTTDFTQRTYRYGGVFLDTGGDAIDMVVVQRSLGFGALRTYRIGKDNSFGHGIWMDTTDAERWWEPGAQWRRIQAGIGDGYSDGHGVEGPAVFAVHGAYEGKWFLLVDVIPSVGYRPLVTGDLDQGWKPLRGSAFRLAPGTKHGSVLALTRHEFLTLKGESDE